MKRVQKIVERMTKKEDQKWLEGNISNRIKGKRLDITNENLEGELEISKGKFSKLNNNLELKEKLDDLETLDLSENKLTSLSIEGLLELRYLVCNYNSLERLEITDCPKLKEISCSHNKFTNIIVKNTEGVSGNKKKSIILPEENKKSLVHLDISDNNFNEEDLSFLKDFTNLEYLYLENWDKKRIDKIEKGGKHNRFQGDLKHLQTLTKLKELNLSNTNVGKKGLNYLPDGLKVICISDERPDSESKNIQKELEKHNNNFKEWKEDYYHSAQRWINRRHPKTGKYSGGLGEEEENEKTRSEMPELDISNKSLKGKLKLEGFDKLIKLNVSDNQLIELDLRGAPKLETLTCKNNSLEEIYISKDKNKELIELRCSGNKITSLDLSGCPNLKLLRCKYNFLTDLNVNGCLELEGVNCAHNLLKNLKLSDSKKLKKLKSNDNRIEKLENIELNFDKLVYLNVNDNLLNEAGLTYFENDKFANLKELHIGSRYKERFEKNMYNHFGGSLKSLEKLTSLEILDISNTDINKDYEYLLELKSLKEVHASTKCRPKSKVKDIVEELRKNEVNINVDENKYDDKKKVEAQEWLEKKYSRETRAGETRLDLNLDTLRQDCKIPKSGYLEGSLTLEYFYNLETFSCVNNRLGKLNISDSKRLTTLDCSGNINLKEVVCVNSQLVNLKLGDCEKLEIIRCDDNQLTSTDFLTNLPCPNKLEELYIYGNNFAPQDLSFLGRFTNLKKLDLSNNKFYGSVEFLKSMDKLEILDIQRTNIDRGWEYLPKNLKYFYHSVEGKKNRENLGDKWDKIGIQQVEAPVKK